MWHKHANSSHSEGVMVQNLHRSEAVVPAHIGSAQDLYRTVIKIRTHATASFVQEQCEESLNLTPTGRQAQKYHRLMKKAH